MEEYSHVAIDKGTPPQTLPILRASIRQNGLQTAQTRGIQLAIGSMRLEHHLHVFLWDTSAAGIRGRIGIESAGNCVTVKVRWVRLTRPGFIFNGSLGGDNGHVGPPRGASTNGAWAYRGDIPADACFIEGLNQANEPGFDNWLKGLGWSGNLT